MNIVLSDSINLILQKLSEIEDKTKIEIISETICMYNYIHEQLALDNKLYICDSDNIVKEQIVFVTPPPDKDAWFNK